jgi:hypothetical protein
MRKRLGLLPDGWFGGAFLSSGDSNPIFHYEVMLGPAASNGIAVGIEGRPDALQPIIRNYGTDAIRIYFPYPTPISSASALRETSSMMVMTFDRAGLARAAASSAQDQRADIDAS